MDKRTQLANQMNSNEILLLKLKCPSCEGSDVTVLEAEKKLLIGRMVVSLLIGLAIIAMLLIMEKPDDISSNLYSLVQLGGSLMVILFIWQGAFQLPLPIKLIANDYEIKAKCSDCSHEWSGPFSW